MKKSYLLFMGFCLLVLTNAMAQTASIKGIVVGENSIPIPGVTVLVKGTTNGTSTDFDGKYTINANKDAILVFSFLGLETVEVAVENQDTINVTMKEDAAQLDEVVVIGYGTSAKKDVTGAIVSADLSNAAAAANTSIFQALQGTLPGLNIGAVSSAGAAPGFSIRGRTSLSAESGPLIVLDGIIYRGSLTALNINDVESIDVLKDASAAAVYGSRAASGVIIIKTKSGSSEKPLFNLNTYTGFQRAANLLDMMDSDEYIVKLQDYFEALGFDIDRNDPTQVLNPLEIESLNEGSEVDWNKELYRSAPITNYELSVSGKTNKTNYFLSGSFTNQEGIIRGDDFERTTLRANFSNNINKWLEIGLNSTYSYRDYSGQPVYDYPGVVASPLSQIYKEGDSGELNLFPYNDQLVRNPLTGRLSEDQDIREDVFGAFYADIKLPIKGLSFRFDYSVGINKRRTARFYGLDTKEGQDDNGSGSKTHFTSKDWLMNNILTYSRTFNDLHKVGATIVYTRDGSDTEQSTLNAKNFANLSLGYNSLELGEIQEVNSGAVDDSSEGFMARATYGYNGKYLLAATFRRDGFSGFAKNFKYANFYSGSLAWVVSEEGFLKDVSWLNRLKLRLSYGENGNQGLGSYSSLALIGTSQYVFGNGGATAVGLSTSSIPNDNLKWETTKSTNFGVNFDIFNNRVSGDIDVYTAKTNDLLVQRTLASYTGYGSVWTNLGKIQNKGVEVLINSENISSENFSWNTSLTFSINRNKIKSLYGEDSDGDGIEDDDVSRGWFIGESLGAIYGYQTNGIYQEGDDIPSGYRPGWFRILDTDGVDGISEDDRSIYANSNPNYRFGIKNELTYKNLSLSFFINSIQGGDGWYLGDNRALNPNTFFPGRANNVRLNYWTPNNPSNTVPAINYSPPRGHRFDQDRSFVRLQDVTLAYDLSNASVIKKINLNGLRFYVSGRNLATWTDWTGYDPELGTTLFGRPLAQSIILGANISF
ncbi:TonB-dependent receptor [Aureibaculum sp. 2210JD6-5]|uniref:SusC/RagA family TonB-linked outer membrane protein n=1 Tax=Aureibaculum sp. 2210JD6-5 TaxID=3103957 RepID=UPI002AACB2FA|nr:TonB-dependent receptor [Aureibaculum sp. 2210JD6-5]MDY7396891.1 TonB-dependent receptor [Aureibaculum sp. 2210JD6-5]